MNTFLKNKKLILVVIFLAGFLLYFFSIEEKKEAIQVVNKNEKTLIKTPTLQNKQTIKQQLQQKWQEISKTTPLKRKVFWQKLSHYDLEKFIKAGVYVKIRYSDKLTPLHLAAAYSKDIDVIDLLVKTGAKINAKALYDATPLHFASAFNTDEDVVKQLIKLGAKVNAKDKEQRTPLHWMSKFAQNVTIIETLLNANADKNLKDIYGQTALDIIKNNKELGQADREKVMRWLKN